jgi:hypothetical protein
MKRSFSLAAALALTVCLAVACGKYGAPRRIGEAAPPETLPSSPIPPPPMGPEGTGILNPTSEPLPAPTAPPEEPEEDPAP